MHAYDNARRWLAMALAMLAGFIDATGFVASQQYFVSFMSGNTTRLSVSLATGAFSPLVPALLILGFVVGVTGGALVVRRAGRWRKTAVIAVSTALICGSAIARAIGSEPLFLACSVLAMGAINNTYSREMHVAVGLTYMTGALVRLGQGLAARLTGEIREGWFLNIVLWASLALGAVGGAAAATRIPAAAPWISVALAALLLLFAFAIERIKPVLQPS
jgi:uncharacterized membrane protein YoaK (UPF0700 family)